MSLRLLSEEALADMALSPRVRLERALSRPGEGDDAGSIVGELERSFHSQIDRYESWTAHIRGFVAERFGSDGERAMVAWEREFFVRYPDVGGVPAQRPESAAQAVASAAQSGDDDLALGRFDDVTAQWRALIDFHRDWISWLLSQVYRKHGIDELEAVLRYAGVRSVLHQMDTEIARAPEVRLRDFVRLLHGHFTELSIVEDDEKFTIVQDPCGTCSRQVTDGRFGPPLDLAVVSERHATTWGRGETTIYRCHVPIWHVVLAGEQIGVPCPVNQCPSGISDDPCRILLYKDPLNTRALDAVPRPS